MTPGALTHLADTHEARSPGLAIVLREWAGLLGVDAQSALVVAKRAAAALVGAQRLAVLAPEDEVRRDVVAVLGTVMIDVAHEVFARDAGRGCMSKPRREGTNKPAPAAEHDAEPASGCRRRPLQQQEPLPRLCEVMPRHVAYVRTLVARLGVSPAHEREDLVQEVLIQAHRSRDSVLEPRALLFGITRHVVFRWISRREHERGALKSRADEETDEPCQQSAELDWQAAERRQAVHTAIDELPPLFREVFVRCEIDEMPMAEVAKDLGIPVNTGYTRLHLARARFAEAVRRYLARRRLTEQDL